MGSSEKRKKEKKSDSKKKKHKHDRSERSSRERGVKSKRRHHRDSSADEPAPGGEGAHEKASLSVSETNSLRAKLGLKPLQVDEPPPAAASQPESDQNVISLSVEETNKLRESLGLKPLDVGNKGSAEVHAPAKNLRQIVETQKLAEKMKMLKEKRRIKEQLTRVKSLGASSADLTDTAAWISRSRDLASRKAAAEAQNRLLDKMDEEFGVGELVEREGRGSGYSQADLKDLTVSHAVDSFKEGTVTILTLQDRGILEEDESGEVLENVNIVDSEKAAKSIENRKSKPGYNPYEEEVDETTGLPRAPSMLSKYDEVIEGERKKSFRIAEVSSAETIGRRMREGLTGGKAKVQNVSLQMDTLPKTATEYYTPDEVASFKKPRKRRRKIRKAKDFEADELAVLASAGATGTDHGSREGRRRAKEGGAEGEKKGEAEAEGAGNMELDIDTEEEQANRGGGGGKRGVVSERELYSVPLEDEDNELEQALARSRRSKLMMEKKSAVLERIASLPVEEEHLPGATKTSMLVLDTTAEFAKGIGQTAEESAEEEEMEEEQPEPETPDPMDTAQGDWKNVDFVTATFGEFQDYDPSRAEQQEVIEAEPSLQRGLSGALQVAQRKGFLELSKAGSEAQDVKDAMKATGSIKARFYQVDKDAGGSHDDGGRRGGRDRHDDRPMGSYSSFSEKKGYSPDVRIVYTDNMGRELDSKEAFRQLSHKFHGKGSGKMKTEKRMKKALEQMALKKMDSEDTPLGSAALLREKQKDANAAYVVLSGGNRLPGGGDPKLSKR